MCIKSCAPPESSVTAALLCASAAPWSKDTAVGASMKSFHSP